VRSIKTEKQPIETGNNGFDCQREIEPDLSSFTSKNLTPRNGKTRFIKKNRVSEHPKNLTYLFLSEFELPAIVEAAFFFFIKGKERFFTWIFPAQS